MIAEQCNLLNSTYKICNLICNSIICNLCDYKVIIFKSSSKRFSLTTGYNEVQKDLC